MAEQTRFTEKDWDRIVSIIAKAFAMDDAAISRLRSNATAKLVAAIPYLADCRERERTAIAHLSTYLVASFGAGREAFDHKAGDDYDVLARLTAIANFEGGDPAIINRGMKALAMIMIRGYKRDFDADKAAGRYNPIVSGAWKAEEKLASLQSSMTTVADAEMDLIIGTAEAKGSWWAR